MEQAYLLAVFQADDSLELQKSPSHKNERSRAGLLTAAAIVDPEMSQRFSPELVSRL
jgi:hypothetical protein